MQREKVKYTDISEESNEGLRYKVAEYEETFLESGACIGVGRIPDHEEGDSIYVKMSRPYYRKEAELEFVLSEDGAFCLTQMLQDHF